MLLLAQGQVVIIQNAPGTLGIKVRALSRRQQNVGLECIFEEAIYPRSDLQQCQLSVITIQDLHVS